MTIHSTIARSVIALLTLVAYLATGTASLSHDSSHHVRCEAHVDDGLGESCITSSTADVATDDGFCSFCVHGAAVALPLGDAIATIVPIHDAPDQLLPDRRVATRPQIVLSLRAPPYGA